MKFQSMELNEITYKVNTAWHISQINTCGNPNRVDRKRGTPDRALRQLLRVVEKKESQKRRLRRTDLRSREMEGEMEGEYDFMAVKTSALRRCKGLCSSNSHTI